VLFALAPAIQSALTDLAGVLGVEAADVPGACWDQAEAAGCSTALGAIGLSRRDALEISHDLAAGSDMISDEQATAPLDAAWHGERPAVGGQTCTPSRQEFILLSDTLGLSMLVDLVNSDAPPAAAESTVLGPFYVPDSPLRRMGSSIIEQENSGAPTRVSGTVLDVEGQPVDGALIDVWQNASNRMYAVQDVDQPPDNLRGRFQTGPDGHFWFRSVRPTDYAIPDDGPVGHMLEVTGRHPWRPAHLHLIASAEGYRTVATHFFDEESPYLESDAVFGVKPSLICHFDAHDPDEPGAPDGLTGPWYTLERDIVLARD